MAKRKWNPAKHPRDARGRFTSAGVGFKTAMAVMPHGREGGALADYGSPLGMAYKNFRAKSTAPSRKKVQEELKRMKKLTPAQRKQWAFPGTKNPDKVLAGRKKRISRYA